MTPTALRREAARLDGVFASTHSAPIAARAAELRQEAARLERPATATPVVPPTPAIAAAARTLTAATTHEEDVEAAVAGICGFIPFDRRPAAELERATLILAD